MEQTKGDIWTMLRDANPREYDKIAFQNGVKDYRGMLKRKDWSRQSALFIVIWELSVTAKNFKVTIVHFIIKSLQSENEAG